MKREARTTPDPTTPPDPQPDRPRTSTPPRIAALLQVVRILLAYGRHLADTIGNRSATPGLTPIAACFGTNDLPAILARIRRGILRAAALERVVLARAARGRDIALPAPRARSDARTPPPSDADLHPANPNAPEPSPPPARRTPRNHTADIHTPTWQELQAQVRRRPLGRTIGDICLDLAVVPGLCTGPFWNQLFDIMQGYGGSVARVMRERFRREQAFRRQQDRTPTRGWDLSNSRPQTVRQILGCSIGHPPALSRHPPTPLAPAATGPP